MWKFVQKSCFHGLAFWIPIDEIYAALVKVTGKIMPINLLNHGLALFTREQGKGGKLLKIKQTIGASLTDPGQRRRLESTPFPSLEQAKKQVESLFPNHLVKAEPGRISVVLKDKSFQVAVFQEVHDSLGRLVRP